MIINDEIINFLIQISFISQSYSITLKKEGKFHWKTRPL